MDRIVMKLVRWLWIMEHVFLTVCYTENIVGTRKVQYKEFPFSVVFLMRASNKVVCMGSVIRAEKILTAAHCFYAKKNDAQVPIELDRLCAVGGSRFTTAKEVGYEKRNIKLITSHPDVKWLENTVLNDIAVIYLDKPFEINEYIKPLKVFSRTKDNFKKKWYSLDESKTECDGLRFGVITTNSNNSFVHNNAFLKATRVSFLPQEQCYTTYSEIKGEIIKGSISCVIPKYSNESMCVGDPGSALICEGDVYAILIKSNNCGGISSPAIYMSLEDFIIMFDLSGQINIANHSFIFAFLAILLTKIFS